MAMTTNFQLERMAKKLSIPLNGIYNKDALEFIKPEPGGYIVNLADSTDPGTHWVAVFLHGKCAYYMDSFGIIPANEIIKFMVRYTDSKCIFYNTKQIQNINAGHCGQWCIIWLKHMAHSRLPKLRAFKQFEDMWKAY